MFYRSYSKSEYDIVSSDKFEILFVDLDHEKNCRKHPKTILKRKCFMKKRIVTRISQRRRAVDDSNNSEKGKVKTPEENKPPKKEEKSSLFLINVFT